MGRQRIHEDGDRDRDGQQRGATVDGPRLEGHIRVLNHDKGFGFIQGDDGQDRFFHKSEMSRESKDFHELLVGDRCSFVTTQTPKGPRAVAVEITT